MKEDNKNKKNSIFDDSFFDDLDEDDDFDFDDEDFDEDEDEALGFDNENDQKKPAPSSAEQQPSAQSKEASQPEPPFIPVPTNLESNTPVSGTKTSQALSNNDDDLNEKTQKNPGKSSDPANGSAKPHPAQAPRLSFPGESILPNVQFRLGCELGQALIPYEDLSTLKTGSVVNFNSTAQGLVVTVNGIKAGEGMLVNIDGKIGIKITRWYGNSL